MLIKLKNFITKFKKWIIYFLLGFTALGAGLSGIQQDLFNNLNVKVYSVCDQTPARTSISDDLKTFKARNPDNSLRELNSNERAGFKSCEISKRGTDFAGIYDSTQYGTRIEIIGEVKAIEVNGQHGIEVFAKAWKNGQPLGFGKDGSVEIERFRIFNPPILVDDPNGTIIKEWIEPATKEVRQRKLREDPLEAIRQVIAHNAKLVGIENAPIMIGKVGNTTSTFYPDPSVETTSVDGNTYFDGYSSSDWNALVTATASDAADDSGTGLNTYVAGSSFPKFWLYRTFALFDTSAIADTDTIDSGTYSHYVSAVYTCNSGTNKFISLVGSTPASNTAITTADHDQVGSTKYASDINSVDLTVSAYNDWALNATGLTNVSKTSITKLALRHGQDLNNEAPSQGGAACYNGFGGASADTAGTTSDPKLVIVHTGTAAPKDNTYFEIIE